MKILTAALILALVSTQVFSQESPPSLKLYAEVVSAKSIQSRDKKGVLTREVLNLKIKFTLKNEGDRNIILIDRHREFVSEELLYSADETEAFAETGGLGYSFYIKDKDWKAIVAGLNKPAPPPDKTLVLTPGASSAFEKNKKMVFESSFGGFSPIYYSLGTLERIKQFEPGPYLRYEMVPWGLNDPILNILLHGEKKKALEVKLRKKWAKFGYLYTDTLKSVPAVLDMNMLSQGSIE